MTTVLVVDDSPIERKLAGRLLAEESAWNIEFADDGDVALDFVRKNEVALVVSDLQMPNMTGLELLAAIKEEIPGLPVIVMTSQGSEEIAVQALSAGAAGYIPKRLIGRDLLKIVRNTLSLRRKTNHRERLMQCMTEMQFQFELPNDSQVAAQAIHYIQEAVTRRSLCDEGEETRIGVALDEALTNALIHGNLEVSSDSREEGDGSFERLIELRRGKDGYKDRLVYVTGQLNRDSIVIKIRDEGPGFDPSKLPDPTDPENMTKASGRGVLLMRAFMDEVVYNDCGNEITLIKHAKALPEDPDGDQSENIIEASVA